MPAFPLPPDAVTRDVIGDGDAGTWRIARRGGT